MWSFAVQDETTDGISEAIAILKSWNNKWKPVAFMVDNFDEGHCKKYRNFT